MALGIDPTNAPRLRLFAWNVFLGSRKSNHIPVSQSITQILSWPEVEELVSIYFAKVDPCYGFVDRRSLERRMRTYWTNDETETSSFEAVMCGVAALGLLFSRRNVVDAELDLVETAKRILEESISLHPSLDIVTAWVLRVAYMRMTAPAHAAWMASCMLMHTLEAAGIHSTHVLNWSADESGQPLTPEIRKRILGVAQHLNIWMSFDIGRSRVHLQTLDFDLPAPREGGYTTELLELLPHSENLNPDKILAQCNLTLLLCRRLRTLNFHFQGSLLSQVLTVTARGIKAAQDLLDDCAPWHHVVNVPFQIICILLALDTPAAIAQLNDGIKTLSNIQLVYPTDAAKEALSTACLLIHLHRKRKEADLKTLSEIVSTYSPSVLFDQTIPSQPQTINDWGSTWLETLPEMPDLQTFDIDRFLNGSSEWSIPGDWTQGFCDMNALLKKAYPWIKLPLIVSAPMLGAATPALAASVSQAGGIGFLAGGTKPAELDNLLTKTSALFSCKSHLHNSVLPIGVGFQNWGCDLDVMSPIFQKHCVAAIWLFAPKQLSDFSAWAQEIRSVSEGRTQVWVQVGTVFGALEVMKLARPDVIVVQGTDAGGHGLRQSASIISLLPETKDALKAAGYPHVPVLAAGGIAESRGVAAALTLGAAGVVMGTRFLAASEAGIAKGWQNEIIRVKDGGITTRRSTLCDRLKETVGWPQHYDGRAIINKGHSDEEAGLSDAENVRMYKEGLKRGDGAWGDHGRMVTYAGTGVGLIKDRKSAAAIVEETSSGASEILQRCAGTVSSRL
ncbi:unnamed protein product [Aureobasidium vineae]|uniref:Xylanolytic transcriptional activator regulatory domain-containing protein n=1 Tax=Aureobasidium vineae TaxID=2773715 RepID=A0A9N8PAU6_9PEZI|nr:unnamed protein product [Aureobasidium vineae]